MVAVRRVEVTAERGKAAWVLECVEAGAVSQCRRLSQADTEMREAIAHQLDLPQDAFEIHLEVIVNQESRDLMAKANQLREEAKGAAAAAAATQRDAARALAAQHLSVRDIGAVMGLSYQRAQQLVS